MNQIPGEPGTARYAIPTYIPLATSDAANGRIWAIYLAEAEKYDKALVESWRDNVTGILIFAGLFSATVTAFIIEGYKTLLADSGDTTVHLLTQISLQLSQMTSENSSTIIVSPVPQFVPSNSALICNILWIISLGLSLCCALIATLVGQWAQDFLHRAEMRSEPVVGARIMSYLYYGIRRFNMHAMVAAIPLLLHGSLLFFFAGLVAFLIPVNVTVMAISSAVPLIFTAVYLTLTLLPLCYFDCPYRTPLSDMLWHVGRVVRELYQKMLRFHFHRTTVVPNVSVHALTMVEAMTRRATVDTDERATRDYRALSWTVKSLIGDKKLQSFVRCIPSLLQADRAVNLKNSPVHRYEEHIKALVDDHDVQLQVRIEGMLRSSKMDLEMPDDTLAERQRVCFCALWAIAKLDPASPVLTDALIEAAYLPNNDYLQPSLLPLATLARNRAFAALDVEMAQVLRYLETARTEFVRGQVKDLRCVFVCIVKMQAGMFEYPHPESFDELLRKGSPASLEWIDRTINFIQRFRADVPYFLLFRYLTYAASLGVVPQEHEYTCSSFKLSLDPFSSAVEVALENTFKHISTKFRPEDAYIPPIFDAALQHLVTVWHSSINRIPLFVIQYLATSWINSGDAGPFGSMVSQLDRGLLWSTISTQLTAESWSEHTDTFITVMFKLCELTCFELKTPETALNSSSFTPYSYEAALSAVRTLPPSSMSTALIALLKIIILASFKQSILPDKTSYIAALETPQLSGGILPMETAVSIPDDIRPEPVDEEMLRNQCSHLLNIIRARCGEAYVQIIAELVEGCTEHPSTTVVETIPIFVGFLPVAGNVHPTHQVHLANSIHRLFQLPRQDRITRRLQENLKVLPLFQGDSMSWLDDPDAAKMITEAFSQHDGGIGIVVEAGSFYGSPSWLGRQVPMPYANAFNY
ncbi:hypothetical protein B0H13DRAFT_913330 [Mycena leptocephala]|nr:hypothetical protein B0H13DRAFT_913330 [Mycena leptocephala]